MSEMRQERPKLSLAVQCSRRMRGIRNKLGRSPNTVPEAIAVHRRAHDRQHQAPAALAIVLVADPVYTASTHTPEISLAQANKCRAGYGGPGT